MSVGRGVGLALVAACATACGSSADGGPDAGFVGGDLDAQLVDSASPAAPRGVLLFGGASGDSVLGDTWSWDGESWVGELVTPRPDSRSHGALAYDVVGGRAVLFGGFDGEQPLDDTWQWDGQRWEALATVDGPVARAHHALAYDDELDAVVLFGGSREGQGAGDEVLGDSWLLLGDVWERGASGDEPPPRAGHAMAFDEATGELVLFGGEGAVGQDLGDTWVRTAQGWVEAPVSAFASPGARRGHALAYDPTTARVLLFGGAANEQLLDDTWVWDGASREWTELAIADAPAPREGHALVYDPTTARVLLFGGVGGGGQPLGQTFAWDGRGWEPLAGEGARGPARAGHALTRWPSP